MIVTGFQLEKQGYFGGLWHYLSHTCLTELLGDSIKLRHSRQFMHILEIIYIERFLSQYQKIEGKKNQHKPHISLACPSCC